MIQGILDFFTNLYNFFTGINERVIQIVKTLGIITHLGPWSVSLIPTVFAGMAAIGIAMVVIKIIKDLL